MRSFLGSLIHSHKWSLAAIQPGVYKDTNDRDTGHFTWLLFQCDACPKWKVEQIAGQWSKESFAREEAE